MGVDGRIYPVGTKPAEAHAKGKTGQTDHMFAEDWFPIQVKQSERVGRPDIDMFEAVMERENPDASGVRGGLRLLPRRRAGVRRVAPAEWQAHKAVDRAGDSGRGARAEDVSEPREAVAVELDREARHDIPCGRHPSWASVMAHGP